MPRRKLISTEFIKFQVENQTVQGVFARVENIMVAGKPNKRYILESDIGTYALLGSVQLDDAFATAKIGDTVEVVYKGTVATQGGFSVKQFEVYRIEEGDEDA